MIKQRLFTLLPSFDIIIGGREFGNIQKEFTFFKPRYEIDYNGWRCEGDFPPLQGTHMSVCRIGGLMNTSFHSYSEWELFLLNNCAGRMNVPGHIPFKT